MVFYGFDTKLTKGYPGDAHVVCLLSEVQHLGMLQSAEDHGLRDVRIADWIICRRRPDGQTEMAGPWAQLAAAIHYGKTQYGVVEFMAAPVLTGAVTPTCANCDCGHPLPGGRCIPQTAARAVRQGAAGWMAQVYAPIEAAGKLHAAG